MTRHTVNVRRTRGTLTAACVSLEPVEEQCRPARHQRSSTPTSPHASQNAATAGGVACIALAPTCEAPDLVEFMGVHLYRRAGIDLFSYGEAHTVTSHVFGTITRFLVTVSASRYLLSTPNAPFRDLVICSLSAKRFFVLWKLRHPPERLRSAESSAYAHIWTIQVFFYFDMLRCGVMASNRIKSGLQVTDSDGSSASDQSTVLYLDPVRAAPRGGLM